MIILGLTGSIGMGKSTTAEMFRQEGVPVHDADASVHALYSGIAVPMIELEFPGTEVDGKVDRQKLGSYVIGHPAAMKKLEAIIHPLVAEARDLFLTEASDAGAKIAVLDVPLLFETGGEKNCDYVAVVTASAEEQRNRVLSRPDMTEEKFEKILSSQMPDAEKRSKADFIIDTSNGIEAARAQVLNILDHLTSDRFENA
ncbi:MAG: dephospho-CoA kinase [Salaquimonas sp.]